ncbi:MAG: hypothetical protein KH405_01060 [Firmicutes bacterium]|nr:hypothetical protein [Bacillota bacterium]
MRTDNALIIGAKTPTDANGTVNRVCPGGYVDVIREGECRGDKIFISSLLKAEDDLDEIVDYCVEKNAKVIVCAGDDLYDSGVLEAREHLSPVMFLHKIGLLDRNCSVVGGICLDRDDADLMAQVGASLIVCPTYSCGTGRGIPVISPALGKIKISLGTFDNRFNKSGSIIEEAKTLYLGTAAVMRRQNALSVGQLAEITGSDEESLFYALNLK